MFGNMKLSAWVIIASAALLGCHKESRNSRTVEAFLLLEPGMTMVQVTNQVGAPDRHAGSGVPRWEYDIGDGSKIVVIPAATDPYDPYQLQTFSGVLGRIKQVRGTNVLWDKKDENHYR